MRHHHRAAFTAGAAVGTAVVLLAAIPSDALAQAAGATSPSLSDVNPGDDIVARWVRAIFPVFGTGASGGAQGLPTSQSVLGNVLGKLSAAMMVLSALMVAYGTISLAVSAAQHGRILSESVSAWMPVRVVMAVGLLLPLPGGFSAGQAIVARVSLAGIGLAKYVYAEAVKGITTDSIPIASPFIPGVRPVVAGVFKAEICTALVNRVAGSQLIPVPRPASESTAALRYNYGVRSGASIAAGTCGQVSLPNPQSGGQSDVLRGDQRRAFETMQARVRQEAQVIAALLHTTRNVDALNGIKDVYGQISNTYSDALMAAASREVSRIRQQDMAQAGSEGNRPNSPLSREYARMMGEQQALGWSMAGAYFLEIARMNADVLTRASVLPAVSQPNLQGLNNALRTDILPIMESARMTWENIETYASTSDGQRGNFVRSGMQPDRVTTPSGEDGMSWLQHTISHLRLDRVVNVFVNMTSPSTGADWTNPFAQLAYMGHIFIMIGLSAFGIMAAANSVGTIGSTVLGAVAGFFGGAGAGAVPGAAAGMAVGAAASGAAGVVILSMLAGLVGLGALMAYVIPMLPFAFWIAGVVGWLILVCEAMVALPLWMLAHMSMKGDGLHGKAIEGYSILFNVLVRPAIMVIGLLCAYFVYSAGTWLTAIGFGIASGFTMREGFFVTNLVGVLFLCSMFVMMNIYLAYKSFSLTSTLPREIPAWIGIKSADRMDMERFGQDVGIVGAMKGTQKLEEGLSQGAKSFNALRNGGSAGNGGGNGGGGGGGGNPNAPAEQATHEMAPQADGKPVPSARAAAEAGSTAGVRSAGVGAAGGLSGAAAGGRAGSAASAASAGTSTTAAASTASAAAAGPAGLAALATGPAAARAPSPPQMPRPPKPDIGVGVGVQAAAELAGSAATASGAPAAEMAGEKSARPQPSGR